MDPKTSTMTKLFHADTLEDLKSAVKRKQIAFVQSIPEFLKAPEGITYSALDIPDERQAEGRQKAENLEIEILFKEDQYDELKAVQTAKTNGYWAIQLPESTSENGKPLTWYFTGTCYIGMSEIAIDDMLKSKLTIYRSSEITESKGFPTE
uniref:Tail tube protein n=1 Tax=Siphoviridae sp. ctiJI15 TaxID=2826431 RepID=A0A8S5NKT6_9CAUD|nr:MAG TPA: tail tube protein [Siphoviridae sp. ctiJI15]